MNLRLERLKYIAAVVIFGTTGLFLRYCSLPSETAAFCRGVIGTLFLLLWQNRHGKSLERKAILRNRKWLLLSGVFLGLNWTFLFAAYVTTTVAVASLCNYLAPLIVILIAPLVLKEPMDPRKVPFVIAAFLGVVLVSGVLGGSGGNVPGVLMGLGAALGFVGIVICNRNIRHISAGDKTIIQLSVSAAVIRPYLLARNMGKELRPDLVSLLVILLLGVFHTGVAYNLYLSGMGSLPVQTVAILGYLEPVVAVLCSAFFLKEPMSPAGWAGAFLIIGAAAGSELMPPAKPEKQQE